MVMIAVSTSLVLTYAFLRTQVTALQISSNSLHRDLALQAAQTGASVGVRQMQQPGWAGVGQELTRQVHADPQGTASFNVQFLPVASKQVPGPSAAAYVIVHSTGIWQSADEPDDRVERHVDVLTQLQPRIAPSPPSNTPHDVTENPGDYDAIQRFALFSEAGTNSLVLDPADRIDGDLWLYGNLRLYNDPHWPSSVRSEYLDSVGRRFTSGDGDDVRVFHPHPLAGRMTFFQSPSGDVQHDLDRLRLGEMWDTSGNRLRLPYLSYSDWKAYRLYAGGFAYQPRGVDYRLQNVELRPTADNPLGVFFREGDVRLDDDVTIQGTLVATGNVVIEGDRVHLSSFNWRGDGGEPILPGAEQWPRLPAVVANTVQIERNVQTTIHGAVVVDRWLKGAGGNFEYVETIAPFVSPGTAVSRPVEQPWSIVRLSQARDLSRVRAGQHAIWLADGDTGGWYPIVGVNDARDELKVVGEVHHPSPTAYRIEKLRRSYVDLAGPVSGEVHDINRTDAWATPTSADWQLLYDLWSTANKLLSLAGLDIVEFTDWLADPASFAGWPYPLGTYGLDLHDVTFRLRHRPEDADAVYVRFSPPLFRPYPGQTATDPDAGLRWKILSWREVQPSGAREVAP